MSEPRSAPFTPANRNPAEIGRSKNVIASPRAIVSALQSPFFPGSQEKQAAIKIGEHHVFDFRLLQQNLSKGVMASGLVDCDAGCHQCRQATGPQRILDRP
jgi:hypothetical protein